MKIEIPSLGVSSHFEQELSRAIRDMLDVLTPPPRAVLLMGSLARGESATVVRNRVVVPENDVDLIVVTDAWNLRSSQRALQTWSKRWSARLCTHVEAYAVSPTRLESPARTLFWLDAALGAARVIVGDDQVTLGLRTLRACDVPLEEAARLLANRAVGIALSRTESRFSAPHVLIRHAHKAVLACGDVHLLAAGRYAGSYAARHTELARLRDFPAVGGDLVDAYADALRYRASPADWTTPAGKTSIDFFETRRKQVERWHMAFESRRLGESFSTERYVRSPHRIYRFLPDVSYPRAAFATARAALAGHTPLIPFIGHPRERLARAAVGLAYADQPAVRVRAARLLTSSASTDQRALLSRLEKLSEIGG